MYKNENLKLIKRHEFEEVKCSSSLNLFNTAYGRKNIPVKIARV